VNAMMQTWVRVGLVSGLLALVAACSSSPDKPKPAPLPAVSGELVVKKVWANTLGPVTTPLLPSVHADRVALASSDGQVV
jgi:outer membrane protein assembly factor BamB